MMVLSACFFIIALMLGVKKPTHFVLFYILASTKFLGFIDPSSFIIGGVEVGYFGLNLIALIALLFKRDWYVIPKKMLLFVSVIIGTLIYGIVKPVIDSNSSVYLSFMASKETWFYFIFFYMMVQKNNIDNRKLIEAIKKIGIYLSIVYCAGRILPQIVPPLYDQGTYVRTFFPTYISLALFIYAVNIKFMDVKKNKYYAIVGLLFLGLFFAAHLSLTLTTLAGFILYVYVFDKNLRIHKYTAGRFAAMAFIGLTMVLLSVRGLYENVASTVEGIITGEDNALSSRDVYNEFRWEAINKQKELGYGYIHQSSHFMKGINTISSNRFMERFTVIDSGYVDMLIKYGFIGTTILMLALVWYYAKGFLKKYKNPLATAMSIYLLQYVFINYTWSVFTFAHGIVPGTVAFHFLLTSQE